jgi:hypothetical protein
MHDLRPCPGPWRIIQDMGAALVIGRTEFQRGSKGTEYTAIPITRILSRDDATKVLDEDPYWVTHTRRQRRRTHE